MVTFGRPKVTIKIKNIYGFIDYCNTNFIDDYRRSSNFFIYRKSD